MVDHSLEKKNPADSCCDVDAFALFSFTNLLSCQKELSTMKYKCVKTSTRTLMQFYLTLYIVNDALKLLGDETK